MTVLAVLTLFSVLTVSAVFTVLALLILLAVLTISTAYVPDKEELREQTRQLNENQRRVVDKVVEYCRSVVKAQERGNSLPVQDHMIVHGAFGTGKSTVIKLYAQWAKQILQTGGMDLDKPYVLKTAFMGAYSSSQYSRSNTHKHITNLVWKPVDRTGRQEQRNEETSTSTLRSSNPRPDINGESGHALSAGHDPQRNHTRTQGTLKRCHGSGIW